MKKLYYAFIFMAVVCLFCVSVSAQETGTIAYDYTDISSVNMHLSSDTSEGQTGLPVTKLVTNDISRYSGLRSIIHGFAAGKLGTTAVSGVSGSTGVTAYIGTDVVGHGEYGWNKHIVLGVVKGITVYVLFDDWDVSGYTGTQTISLNLDDNDYRVITKSSCWGRSRVYPTVTPSGAYIAFVTDLRTGDYLYYLNGQSTAYNNVVFHQTLDYQVDGAEYDLSFSKNGFSNEVKIISSTGQTLLDTDDSTDIDQLFYDSQYLDIYVYNPFLSGSDPWYNQIPETTTPITPDNTAIIHSYVSDAVTRNLIGNGHNVTVTYDDSSSIETQWPGAISHTTIDWSDSVDAELTISAPGYSDLSIQLSKFYNMTPGATSTWLPIGDDVDNYAYLQPVGTPSNTTAWATFEVQEQISGETYFYSSGAAVTVGDTTLITGGLGSCSFELEAGTYQYTVKKTGFQTVSGSFSLVASNQYVSVKLPKIPTAPTPTGEPGVDYPYSDVDPRAQAEESVGIIFDSLPSWAALCVMVVTISFIGWMSPKKGRR